MTGFEAFRRGVLACCGIPGIGLSLSMVGFGAIARESGLELWVTLVATFGIWGLPGQIAFADMMGVGAGLPVVFLSVTLANMRMMPMIVTGLPAATGGQRLSFLKRLIMAQFMAVSGWVFIVNRAHIAPVERRPALFAGFVFMLMVGGMMGTLVGYIAGAVLPPDAVRVIVFMTPLYLLMMTSEARQNRSRGAIVLGMAMCPALYPIIGDWAIPVAGILGGSLAFAAIGEPAPVLNPRVGQADD